MKATAKTDFARPERSVAVSSLSTRRLLEIVETDPDGIVVTTADGTIHTANPSALRLLDFSGGTSADVPLVARLADGHREPFLALMAQAVSGLAGTIEAEVAGPEGSGGRWLEIRVASLDVEDGEPQLLLLRLRDITPYRRTLAALSESEQRFASAFHLSPISQGIFAPDGKLVEANEAFCRVAGLPLDALIGKTAVDSGQIDAKTRARVSEIRRANGGVLRNHELEMTGPDGTTRTTLLSVLPIALGGTPHSLVMSFDITPTRKREAELRKSQLQLALFVENAPAALAMLDCDLRYLAVSRRWLTDYALGERELAGQELDDVFPATPPSWKALCARALDGETISNDDESLALPDGRVRRYRIAMRPWHTLEGNIGGIVIHSEDITEAKEAEESLRDREGMLESVANHLPGMVARVGADLRYRYVSAGYERMLGIPGSYAVGRRVPDVVGERFTRFESLVRRVLAGEAVSFEQSFPAAEGGQRHALMRLIPDRDENGDVQGYFVIGVDITERVLADERISRQRSALISLTSAGERSFPDLNQAVARITEAASRTLGVERVSVWRFVDEDRQIECVDLYDAPTGRHGAGRREPVRLVPGHLDLAGDAKVIASEDALNDPQLEQFTESFKAVGIRSVLCVPIHVHGKCVGLLVHGHVGDTRRWTADEETFGVAIANIISLAMQTAQRRQAEHELRVTNQRFRELASTVQEVFWISNVAQPELVYVSPAYEAIWGRSCQSLYDEPRSWLAAIHPDDRARVELAEQSQAIGTYDIEYRVVRPDGEVRWIRDRAFPVHSADGRIERIVGAAIDITDRMKAEEQLRQSQKMDAIGQLAGGIAHDFNNILSAIMMQAEVTTQSGSLSDEDREGLSQIADAARRAANLTRQLLLFSRRQVMQPKIVDVNAVVGDLAKMLCRIIGEDIQLRLDLQATSLSTLGDAGMLDQVLLNLAVNARDAMPRGGVLTIATSAFALDAGVARRAQDMPAGDYVCLTVSDTGCGIASDILPRIFEPFFTTKPIGCGTGLGLATVFGVVRQHNGWVDAESEPGKGARFSVYLPAADGVVSAPEASVAGPVGTATETILLVEDEIAVRKMARTILTRRGYRVLEAADGVSAYRVWQEHRGEIQLLLTDLVMPAGMSGKDLARRVHEEAPGLKVIYMSGYSVEFAGRTLNLTTEENFVEKPFSAAHLLGTVRRCLDASGIEALRN